MLKTLALHLRQPALICSSTPVLTCVPAIGRRTKDFTRCVWRPGDVGSQEVQQVIGHPKEHLLGRTSTWKQEDPQPPHFKREDEELWITQEGEGCVRPQEADLPKLPLTGVSVKTEDHEDEPVESSLHHRSPSEESRGAEPPNSSLLQLQTTEMDVDFCEVPLSVSEDQDGVEEPLSSETHCEDDMRTHTGNKHSKRPEKKVGTKGFTCSFCVKSFFHKTDFARHIRTHTGEKPFTCSVCGQKFARNGTLTTHMRTHTGEKPFTCSVCAKTFSQKPHMIKHMRTHTREKLFTCSVCGKRFSQKSSIVIHMRTHTRKNAFQGQLGSAARKNRMT
ncbi:zinc finger protein 84-like isoform X2 [Entelurus aequoreus]|uniref:zinc finger protein 84-like isoform X2 n=1 Tax=Entelurus aequoreus TaxID=161455 RepID=UPI002B1CF8A7|nr:zinc finger protein 84-like isoform X2 [Entelurus aequoreus]